MVGGATPEEELIKQLFPLIQQVLPGIFDLFMKNLGPFLQIIMLLAGAGMRMGGSKNRSTQRGGGLSQRTKDRLISKLETLKANFQAKEGKEDVVACIDVFINKFKAEQVDPKIPEPSTENISLEAIEGQIVEAPASEVPAPEVPADESTLDKFKRIVSNKVTGLLNSKIASVKGKFTEEEYKCLVTLKNAILSDVITDVRSKIEAAKTNSTVTAAIEGFDKLRGFAGNAKEAVSSRLGSLKESGIGFLNNAVGNLKLPFGRGSSTTSSL